MTYIHGKSIIKIAIADDHEMFRELLSSFIDSIENCKVVILASDGNELVGKIENKPNTDLVLLDISMPGMNGYETALILREKFPEIKILFCSVYNNELAICRMIGCGGNGFIHKGASTNELKKSINDIMRNGYSFPALRNTFYFNNSIKGSGFPGNKFHFTNTELRFLSLICTEKTYKEIASDLGLSVRQVDYIREGLFIRLGVQSRIGLAFKASYSGILADESV